MTTLGPGVVAVAALSLAGSFVADPTVACLPRMPPPVIVSDLRADT